MPDRRRRAWADTIFNLTVASAGSITPLDLLFDLPEMTTKTVTRLIIGYDLFPEPQGSNEVGIQRVHAGIGVVSSEAFALAAVPDPGTSIDFPTLGWAWRDVHSIAINEDSTFGGQQFVYPRVDADIRAMRKVDKGILFFAVDNILSTGSSFSIRIVGMVRALCLT